MRRVIDILDDMNGVATFELGDGRFVKVDARQLQRVGAAELFRSMGMELPKERVPVFQGGRKVGTVPSWFDPLSVRSDSFFYQPRRGDFIFSAGRWEADKMLGPGDLDAIPEFRWDSQDYEARRAGRKAEMNDVLLDAIRSMSKPPETDENAA